MWSVARGFWGSRAMFRSEHVKTSAERDRERCTSPLPLVISRSLFAGYYLNYRLSLNSKFIHALSLLRSLMRRPDSVSRQLNHKYWLTNHVCKQRLYNTLLDIGNPLKRVPVTMSRMKSDRWCPELYYLVLRPDTMISI